MPGGPCNRAGPQFDRHFSGNPLYMIDSVAIFALSRLVRPEF